MIIFFWIFAGVSLNMVIGAAVWSALDDDNQTWLTWYKSCPEEIAWFACPLVLTVWPTAFWMAHKRKSHL